MGPLQVSVCVSAPVSPPSSVHFLKLFSALDLSLSALQVAKRPTGQKRCLTMLDLSFFGPSQATLRTVASLQTSPEGSVQPSPGHCRCRMTEKGLSVLSLEVIA